MTTRRLLKAAEAVREVVSMAILTELQDPRVQNVTVTQVEMAPDMKSAKVMVSIMGDEKQETLAVRGLQNSAGFLQSLIADRIDSRYTPRLNFVIDKGVKHSLEVARILKEVLPPEKTPEKAANVVPENFADTVLDDPDVAEPEAGEPDADEPDRT